MGPPYEIRTPPALNMATTRFTSPGSHNVIHKALVKKENIILLTLHIKLGLMKQYVKAIKNDKPAFQYLKTKFSKLVILR